MGHCLSLVMGHYGTFLILKRPTVPGLSGCVGHVSTSLYTLKANELWTATTATKTDPNQTDCSSITGYLTIAENDTPVCEVHYDYPNPGGRPTSIDSPGYKCLIDRNSNVTITRSS
jgi:hypothetical protein